MKALLINQNTKTIVDVANQKTLYFGMKDFYDQIILNGNCFICGAPKDSKEFNDEHVIPNWILRKFKMHNDQIRLPNGDYIKYGSYTVPCCKECNTELGEAYEIPISNLLKLSYDELSAKLIKNPDVFKLFFRWVGLIYFKTHLKDLAMPVEKDLRIKAGNIGQHYDWGDKHHIHCIARMHYTGAIINEKAYGTILVLPVLHRKEELAFDYMDSIGAQTVLIQVGRICIIASLNDSKAALQLFGWHLQKIAGALTSAQLREVFAHVTFLSANLKRRPRFFSTLTKKGYEIKGSRPRKFELKDKSVQQVTFNELFHTYMSFLIPTDAQNRESILENIKDGKFTYLFDENGEFIRNTVA
jgi:hypothetical protein